MLTRLRRALRATSGTAALAALPGFLALAACGPSPHEEGLTWGGKPLVVAQRVDAPRDSLGRLGFEALIHHPPSRLLRVEPGEWADTLWLLEYKDDLSAYAAYQQLSPDPEALLQGEIVCGGGGRVCFRRGRWVGAVDAWSWKGGSWFAQALALPGAPEPGGLPEIFGSLLHQDRIPGSERILGGEFMGHKIEDAVYSLKADCRGDTALIYASRALKIPFAARFASQPGWVVDTIPGWGAGVEVYSELTELPPVVLRFSGQGMVGVEGCFDGDLIDFWLKMQARGLKNLK